MTSQRNMIDERVDKMDNPNAEILDIIKTDHDRTTEIYGDISSSEALDLVAKFLKDDIDKIRSSGDTKEIGGTMRKPVRVEFAEDGGVLVKTNGDSLTIDAYLLGEKGIKHHVNQWNALKKDIDEKIKVTNNNLKSIRDRVRDHFRKSVVPFGDDIHRALSTEMDLITVRTLVEGELSRIGSETSEASHLKELLQGVDDLHVDIENNRR